MNRTAKWIEAICNIPVLFLNMLFDIKFHKLLVVCLKMLFRRSTRKRFICLVILFIFMMGFNTFSYVKKYHKTEEQKRNLLGEKAFKVFFLRLRTNNSCERFLFLHGQNLQNLGGNVIHKAFLYQNNLYIHFLSEAKSHVRSGKDEKEAMANLYDVFNIKSITENFYPVEDKNSHSIKARNIYVDHNGSGLTDVIKEGRHDLIKSDLTDIADEMRGNIKGKRLEAFNIVKNRIVDNLKPVLPDYNKAPNQYLSRVELIVPMNFLHVIANIYHDNAADIMDIADSVRYVDNTMIETDREYFLIPENYAEGIMYGKLPIYPRYLPLYIPALLKTSWNWLLFQNISINNDLIKYIDQLHFKGHYMFSYEKGYIIKEKVKKINDDIMSNHIRFYLTDLTMGIAFPFMISLFAFIHLKAEIAFLLMFKNRIREILFIFWALPLSLILFIKGGILSGYLIYLFFNGFGVTAHLALPLTISFILASIVFYPVNRWCFGTFTGDSLNLYTLHKGR